MVEEWWEKIRQNKRIILFYRRNNKIYYIIYETCKKVWE